MERDPVRFIWRAAPGLNAACVALALAGGVPLLWAALDLVGVAMDALAMPRDGTRPVRILRYALDLPERIRDAPFVLFPGFDVPRASLPLTLTVAFAGLAALAAFLAGTLAALTTRIGRRATEALVARVVDGVAGAPAAAAADARHAAFLAGEAIEREGGTFGPLAILPILAGAALFVPVAYVALGDLESGLVILAGLCALSAASAWRARTETRRGTPARGSGPALQRALADLARNLPAVHRHGTQRFERDRILAAFADGRHPGGSAVGAATRFVPALLLAALLGLFGVVAASLWAPASHELTPGIAASAMAAAAIAVGALATHLRWRRRVARLRPLFGEIASVMASFQARRGREAAASLPASGPLALAGVTTGNNPTGRLSGLDLLIRLPAQVALCGARESGIRTLAALLGGEIAPRSGQVTLAGIDLRDADPAERVTRIAFAGGETYFFPGSLRANLLYGTGEDGTAADRLADAIAIAGLDGLVERRGLAAVVDTRREPELADAIVAARPAIRDELASRGLSDLVAPFAPDSYNPNASIGENVLFGAPVGDTFGPDRLPSHPFLRGLLDAEGLSKPLAEMGADIARGTIEMFADLPDDSSLVERFALMSTAERDVFEPILDRRRAGGRAGTASSRDAEKLIGLAFRYCERRHRLGLVGPELENRILRVRAAFADKLPKPLEPAVEFFHPDRVCAAVSLRDNLLFGRPEQGRAQGEREIGGALRAVLDRAGLWPAIARIGLSSRVDPADVGMSAAEAAAAELVRCLVRQPDNLVVEHALSLLSERDAVGLVERLRAFLDGRGLLVVVPEAHEAVIVPLLGGTVRLVSGRLAETTGDLAPAPEKTKSQRGPERVSA